MAQHPLHIVHTEASCGWGGQEIRILTESAGLIGRGHRVTLLCPPEAPICQKAAEYGVPVVPLPMAKKRWAGLAAIYRWLKQNRPDIIITHSSTDSWLSALAAQVQSPATPVVRVRHISAPVTRNIPTKWLYGTLSRHVVTTGELICDQLVHHNGIPRSQVSAIPTGIDLQHFKPGDRQKAREQLGIEAKKVVGIVATLRSWKGHHYLVEAFAQLQDPDLHLLIVGDGPQRPNLEALIAEQGVQQRVHMVGQQKDVVPWLQAMDLFVLPSYANEGVPQALMQAMACGLPCLSTPAGSIAEILHHEQNGLITEPHSVPLLSAGMERLLGDESLRKELGAAARQDALRDFGLERMLDRMLALISTIIH
uniref:Putative GT4: distantly related to 1, 2-diacylglycerol 3-glucosyltransferase n=1 Tax=Magnetococcus massalia (strain MO-1) TaxID=451514 RepID=A0A1S7LH17_MAGMO|nr:putative GT4 : distantly related to 1, 2-diacylglycerol 3-glucosyltransferase [Candidatus Magnetococcus massalia]